MNHEIVFRVEQLLGELGEYTPLDLLLQEGRLTYADYEAWRQGQTALLDAVLFGAPQQIREMLVEAENYLVGRGWLPRPLRYPCWSDGQPGAEPGVRRDLVFSADRELNACFLRGYHRNADQPQLDLFSDNAATSLVNGIVAALAERAFDEARRQLERLYVVAPDHPRVGDLDQLTEASERLGRKVHDVAAELADLRDVVAPLADDLLGRDSLNLLIPLWRRLGDSLAGRAFDPSVPAMHASYAAAQALDWSACISAVEAESGWRDQPVLALRHARACDRQFDRGAALASWFALCWRFPTKLESAIESSQSAELRRLWSEFSDLDPQLLAADFPAWALIRRPGLVQLLPESLLRDPECPESFGTLYQLRRTDAGATADTIALRATLQHQSPGLLRELLNGIASGRV